MDIGGFGGIVLVVMLAAAVMLVIVISSNSYNWIFSGGICGFGSDCGVN